MIALFLLLLVLAGLALATWYDVRRYRQFKQLTDGRLRRRAFYLWTAQGFVLFVGGSLAILALIGRLPDLTGMPSEFGALANLIASDGPDEDSGIGGLLLGLVIGGVIVGIAIAKKRSAGKPVMIGDVEPMLPRNRAELLAAVPLAINAGVGEELFFRLALPLLVTQATGSAPIGLVMGAVVFGLVHAYQGVAGVLATTAMAAVFTALYLASGSLWLPILVHAGMDLIALVVRPGVGLWLAKRREQSS